MEQFPELRNRSRVDFTSSVKLRIQRVHGKESPLGSDESDMAFPKKQRILGLTRDNQYQSLHFHARDSKNPTAPRKTEQKSHSEPGINDSPISSSGSEKSTRSSVSDPKLDESDEPFPKRRRTAEISAEKEAKSRSDCAGQANGGRPEYKKEIKEDSPIEESFRQRKLKNKYGGRRASSNIHGSLVPLPAKKSGTKSEAAKSRDGTTNERKGFKTRDMSKSVARRTF